MRGKNKKPEIGYFRSAHGEDYPSASPTLWQKYRSRMSEPPPQPNWADRKFHKFRESFVEGDIAILGFIFITSYILLALFGFLFPNLIFVLAWVGGITFIFAGGFVFAVFGYGRKLIYCRTHDGSSAMRKLLRSNPSSPLAVDTLKRYISTLQQLDDNLAEVETARLDLMSALRSLPRRGNWDALSQLSFEVDALESQSDISGIEGLAEEINNEIIRLDSTRQELIARINYEVEKALQGYDPVILAERKKTAEQVVAAAKRIRPISDYSS